MTDRNSQQARYALEQALAALRSNNKLEAHRWAGRAASLAPDWETPWLILAAASKPAASIQYLKKALEINPTSQRARNGMHWAIQQYRESTAAQPVIAPTPPSRRAQPSRPKQRTQRKAAKPAVKKKPVLIRLLPFIFTLAILCIVLAGLFIGFPPRLRMLAQ